MSVRFPVLWLTGNSGAGKSTLAFALRELFNEHVDAAHPLARRVIVLDGDEMRETISRDEGFSPEDRRKHNMRVARLAALLRDAGHLVIVSVIAPFESVREEVAVLCDPVWIYIQRSNLDAADRPYEPPLSPALTLNNDILTIEQTREHCLEFIERSIITTFA